MTGPQASLRGGLRAVVFDMDGVLVDTEPAWRRVETAVFAAVGLHLSEADCRSSMGMRVTDMVRLWFGRHPWEGPGVDEVTARIVTGVAEHVRSGGEPMPGAVAAVRLVRECGLLCAVASSSPRQLIDAAVRRLGVGDAVDVICSAEDEVHGKPAPDVYRRAAARLGIPAAACLAVEDSALGVLSARAAGMPCVVVPDQLTGADQRLDAATDRLASLLELDRVRLAALAAAYFP